jgi:hypothetical protein
MMYRSFSWWMHDTMKQRIIEALKVAGQASKSEPDAFKVAPQVATDLNSTYP